MKLPTTDAPPAEWRRYAEEVYRQWRLARRMGWPQTEALWTLYCQVKAAAQGRRVRHETA